MTAGAPIGILHFVEEQVYKAQKALIAAKFNGLVLTQQKFDIAKDGKKATFLAMNPVGKVPCLETDMGCITSSNAIARYVARCRADTSLYGNSFNDEGQIDTWMEFSTYELEIPLAVWLYPVLGLMEQPPAAATENAKNDVKKALQVLEDCLKASAFLVGDFVSLADIVVVCVLKDAFARLFDPAFRKPFVKVCAWFEICSSMPQFAAVLGSTALCKQAEKPQAVKAAFKAIAAPKKEAKKEEPKKDAKKEAAPAKQAAAAPAAAPAAAGMSAEVEAQIKAIGDEIRSVKEKLKGEGLSSGAINKNADIMALVAKLSAAKAGGGGAPPAAAPKAAEAPKAAPAAAAAPASGGDGEAQIKAVGDQIRVLKEKLKADGLSGGAINKNEEIKALVGKLQELKAGAPAAAPAASPKAAPAAAPAAGGDAEAQIKAVGDNIRQLKEKLKGEGLSGKKLNDHPEVKEAVAKLAELKKQLA